MQGERRICGEGGGEFRRRTEETAQGQRRRREGSGREESRGRGRRLGYQEGEEDRWGRGRRTVKRGERRKNDKGGAKERMKGTRAGRARGEKVPKRRCPGCSNVLPQALLSLPRFDCICPLGGHGTGVIQVTYEAIAKAAGTTLSLHEPTVEKASA